MSMALNTWELKAQMFSELLLEKTFSSMMDRNQKYRVESISISSKLSYFSKRKLLLTKRLSRINLLPA
jgi:hypothetical protein